MKYKIPGADEFEIKTIILDLNGTLTVDGRVVPGVHERLRELKAAGFNVLFFTGNTRGDADVMAEELGIDWEEAKNGADKKARARKHDPATCASIGNGLIDKELMEAVKLRIVTLQSEGVHVQTLLASDIVVPSIIDALDLFLDPDRLIATLRT